MKNEIIFYNSIAASSTSIPTYNLCDDGDITNVNGILTSPGYPKYGNTVGTCVRKIVAPADKVIRLRVVDMKITAPGADKVFVFNLI